MSATGFRLEIRTRWRWLKLLCLGAITWIVAVVALGVTQDPNLIPLTVTAGGFVVPVCGAIYVFDRLYDSAFPPVTIVEAFALGGTLGVVLAVLGEYLLLGNGGSQYLGVGLIEEASKLAVLWLVARRLGSYSIRDGIVLGVAVGFGFASFESSGYALVALFGAHGLELHNMISTVLERGLLAPVGHGLWTGVLGGVLFMAARHGRLRLARSVVAAYLFVALLHALYDSSSGIGALIVGLLTDNASHWKVLLAGRIPVQMESDLTSFTISATACLCFVSAVGVYAMSRLWRVATAAGASTAVRRGRG
ncbi:MAG: protease PrsW [Solirubrobacteraceae bacterium]|jgi:RsiW-degrading membrane proteinase PrsW (M82 family)|nr:protease PrsW [Solirubrobacteraceae bacterium]